MKAVKAWQILMLVILTIPAMNIAMNMMNSSSNMLVLTGAMLLGSLGGAWVYTAIKFFTKLSEDV